ncbi:MAG: MASE1 domain-containing protein [Terriglobales bacterium]
MFSHAPLPFVTAKQDCLPLQVESGPPGPPSRANRTAAQRSPAFGIAALTASYLAASLFARYFVIRPEILAPVWLGAGVLLIGILWLPLRVFVPAVIAVFFAGLLGNWATGVPLLPSAAFAFANCIGGALAAFALKRRLPRRDPRLESLRGLGLLVLIGCILANAVGALAGATVVAAFNFGPFGHAWVLWVLSNALGVLIVVPLASEWRALIADGIKLPRPRSWTEAIIFSIVLVGAGLLSLFRHPDPAGYTFIAPFLMFPLLVWAALRFGPAGAASASFVLTLLVLVSTARGLGRFSAQYESLSTRFVELQLFLLAAMLCSLIPAIVLREREHSSAALNASQRELVAAKQLAETHLAQLRTTLDAMAEGVFVADSHAHPILANKAFFAMHGFDPSLPLPAQLSDYNSMLRVFDEQGRPVPVSEWPISRALRGETVSRLVMRLDLGTRRAIFQYNAAPVLGPKGEVRMAVLTMEDITGPRRAEEALIRSEKLATVGRMAATVAHEINNPLAAAMNALFLASVDDSIPASVRQNLELADRELQRVAHITRQTLGFYRELGKSGAVQPAEVIDGILDLFGPKLRNKNITVRRRYTSTEQVYTVEGELRQIISNLVANAIDAVAPNGVLYVRTAGPADDRGGRPMVRFTIADNGAGIAPEHLKRIFEPFFTTKESVGTGLGLWVTCELVKKHEGKIRVRSRLGRGAVFSVWLPTERRRRQRDTTA